MKNIQNNIFLNFKNSKIMQKTPKKKKIKKCKKTCKEAPNETSSVNQTQLELNKYSE